MQAIVRAFANQEKSLSSAKLNLQQNTPILMFKMLLALNIQILTPLKIFLWQNYIFNGHVCNAQLSVWCTQNNFLNVMIVIYYGMRKAIMPRGQRVDYKMTTDQRNIILHLMRSVTFSQQRLAKAMEQSSKAFFTFMLILNITVLHPTKTSSCWALWETVSQRKKFGSKIGDILLQETFVVSM